MKICPTCRRTYDDDGLNFCLEDGSVLTFAPAVDPGAPTVVMDRPRATDPSPRAGMQTSWDVQNPSAYSTPPKKKSKAWVWALGLIGLAVLLCGGGVVGLFVYKASTVKTNSTSNLRTSTNSSNSSRSNNTANSNSSSDTNSNNWNVTGSAKEVDLSEWVKEFSIWGTTEFKDGEFLMAAKQKGYYYVLVATDEYKTENAVTRVTVRNPDSVESTLGYGLIFHSDATPLENDYAFLIDSKRRRFRVVRHEPEEETTVTSWTNSKLINEGSADNVLEVRDLGEKIELYINSQLATTVTNKEGPKSGVPGLYAGDGAKIGFKKLEIVK